LGAELNGLDPPPDVAGYQASFVYCANGTRLRGSLYPPVTVLFRRAGARYVQDGHTQRVQVKGRVAGLRAPLYHDDRKPIARWLQSQSRYMRLEAAKLRSALPSALRWQDRMRLLRVVSPFAVPIHLLFIRGLVLDGWAGVFYALQRSLAEAILSLYLIEADVSAPPARDDDRPGT